MIRIENRVLRTQKNFWNHCLFHPTDAVEDAWGRRILDRMAKDRAVRSIRVYAMLEDIVYIGEEGELKYDFRLSDLRLDYLVGLGYDLVLAYAGIPDCLASSLDGRTSNAKGGTRYKGKMWNTAPPKDISLWEEVCYEYTKHLVERYGEGMLSRWRCHCFNEPDEPSFFLANLTKEDVGERVDAYFPMYEAFVRGVRRATASIPVGGPALSDKMEFLEGFLSRVKASGVELNYISLHFYGTRPAYLNAGERLSAVANANQQKAKYEIIKRCGFGDTPIIADEWGAATNGFFNSEECKILMFRETEVNSAYFVTLIDELMRSELPVERLMICLSGQHEMTEDFTGFRNFFTLNFIAKPIYNSYVLTSRLYENLLSASHDNELVRVIPMRSDGGRYAVALTYASEHFDEDIPERAERVRFPEDIVGRRVTVWCIDREHTNPYRLYQKMGISTPSEEQIRLLREEGRLKPASEFVATDTDVEITMTANSVFLITVE